MPTGKKGKGRKANRKTKPPAPGPLSDCKLPNDVILNIFSRLPVEDLLRIRSVCKPWKSLTRNHKLISLHLAHHRSSPPLLLLHSLVGDESTVVDKTTLGKLSFISLQPPDPYITRAIVDYSLAHVDVIGTYNGVVCSCIPPWGDFISITNPLTIQALHIHTPRPKPNPTIHSFVSMGFGFDPVMECYKVIRIHSVKPELKIQSEVFVYSTSNSLWRKVAVKGPKIDFGHTSCSVVLNGVPYWFAYIQDDHGERFVLLWFDVREEVFHHIPMPILSRKSNACLVDWKGDFAMITYPLEDLDEENGEFVDVWVIENKEWWISKCRVGPIWGMKRLLGCSPNGQIVGTDVQGNLIMYDPEIGGIKYLRVYGNMEHNFAVFNYRESLVSLKGESLLVSRGKKKLIRQ